MGKKITIDSSTLMNKVFEVIEAKKIFNISYKKISILTHPDSYVHAILKLKNGLTKILIHEPDMKIPIFNSIYNNKKFIKSKKINLKILNNLDFKNVDRIKFPTINLLNKLPNKNSLYETILISINDYLVFKFLEKKISFKKLLNLIVKWSSLKEFQKYKKIKPNNINQIYKLRDYVSLKMNSFSI
jgi:1-deoxy-D-xylulose-5-phosphate reductoisomerase